VRFDPYVLGRLESFWGADVEFFKPERWLIPSQTKEGEVEVMKYSQYKFPVFNAGPRLCLGKDMARMEASVLAAKLLMKYRFNIVPFHNREYQMTIILRMKNGLFMEVQKRL